MVIRREEVLRRLRRNVSEGCPIVSTGAGTGISARFEETGRTDLTIVYNSGRYRMAGRGSSVGLLAYGDVSQIVMDIAGEMLPVAKDTLVLTGANGMGPLKGTTCFLKKVRGVDCPGVQDLPAVGLFKGRVRQTFEETGMGYNLEVEMIRIAHGMDLFITPYTSSLDEAVRMAKVGADVTAAHCGYTVDGSIGAESITDLDIVVKTVQEIHDAATSERSDVIALCHEGPAFSLEDAKCVLTHTKGVHGFYGTSSAERPPVEMAIKGHIEKFKKITF